MSLEDELNIPSTATIQPPSGQSWSLQTKGSSTSTPSISIAVDTAIRPNPRCLVVGRQAKFSDMRIQHGSISRRHAALYFVDGELLLQDFGSKKGTTVNNTILAKGSTCRLHGGDEIIFGHVRESVFLVQCKSTEGGGVDRSGATVTGDSEIPASPEMITPVQIPEQQLAEEPEPGAGLTGRAKREAEIAAMMNSLEQTPSYNKYIPQEGHEPKTVRNINSSNGNRPSQASPNVVEDNGQLDQISETAQKYKLPILERMTIEQPDTSERRHMVTCLGMDPSGARFVVGTTDNTLRLYDFGGMDRLRQEPFKMIQADDGHVVSDICYSNTGDRILVGTGSLQPFVLDRDGAEMYVTLFVYYNVAVRCLSFGAI